MGFWIWLGIFVATFILGQIFRPRPPKVNMKPGQFDLPQAEEDGVIPVIFGTVRVTPNVVNSGRHFAKGRKLKGQTIGFMYGLEMQLVLCQGPVDSVEDIYVDNRSLKTAGLSGKDSEFYAQWRTKIANQVVTPSLPWAQVAAGLDQNDGITVSTTAGSLTIIASAPIFSVADEGRWIEIPGAKSGVGFIRSKIHKFNSTTSVDVWPPTKVPLGTLSERPDVSVSLKPFWWPFNPTKNAAVINAVSLFGGVDSDGGLEAFLEFFFGTTTQAASPGLANIIPGGTINDAPAYQKICYAMMYARNFGHSNFLRPIQFALKRIPSNLGNPTNADISGDANGAEIIYEAFIDTDWGIAVPSANIDTASFQAAAATLKTEGLGCSFILDSRTGAEDFIEEVLRHIDGVITPDPTTGKLKLKLIRDDYVFANLPIIQQGDNGVSMKFMRGNWRSTYNRVKVTYTSRINDYKTASAQADDLANFQITGEVREKTFDFSGFTTRQNAQKAASRTLRTLSPLLSQATIKTDRSSFDMMVGDCFRLTWPDDGITDLVMRVSRIGYGSLEDGEIEIDAIEDVFASAFAIYSEPNGSGWIPNEVPESPGGIPDPNDLNILDYGVVADMRLFTASITTGTAVVTASAAVFAASDVGKEIHIKDAGPAVVGYEDLIAVITVFTSPTQVTVSVNASRTVTSGTGVFGTDNTFNIQRALEDGANTQSRVWVPDVPYPYIGYGYKTLAAKSQVRMVGASWGAILYSLSGRRGAMFGYNKISNGTFETDVSGWTTAGAGTTFTRVASGGKFNAYGSIAVGNLANAGVIADTANQLKVFPNQIYILSAWLNGLAGGGSKIIRIDIEWRDRSDALISTDSELATLVTSTWTEYLVQVKAPINADRCRVNVFTNTAQGAFTFGLDTIRLEPGIVNAPYTSEPATPVGVIGSDFVNVFFETMKIDGGKRHHTSWSTFIETTNPNIEMAGRAIDMRGLSASASDITIRGCWIYDWRGAPFYLENCQAVIDQNFYSSCGNGNMPILINVSPISPGETAPTIIETFDSFPDSRWIVTGTGKGFVISDGSAITGGGILRVTQDIQAIWNDFIPFDQLVLYKMVIRTRKVLERSPGGAASFYAGVVCYNGRYQELGTTGGPSSGFVSVVANSKALAVGLGFTEMQAYLRGWNGTWYKPPAAALTNSGLGNYTASRVGDDDIVNKAFDVNTPVVAGAFLKIDLGAGNDKKFCAIKIGLDGTPSTDATWKLQYSDNDSVYTDVTFRNASVFYVISGIATAPSGLHWSENDWNAASIGAHRYWKLLLTTAPSSGTGMFYTEVHLMELLDTVKYVNHQTWPDWGDPCPVPPGTAYIKPFFQTNADGSSVDAIHDFDSFEIPTASIDLALSVSKSAIVSIDKSGAAPNTPSIDSLTLLQPFFDGLSQTGGARVHAAAAQYLINGTLRFSPDASNGYILYGRIRLEGAGCSKHTVSATDNAGTVFIHPDGLAVVMFECNNPTGLPINDGGDVTFEGFRMDCGSLTTMAIWLRSVTHIWRLVDIWIWFPNANGDAVVLDESWNGELSLIRVQGPATGAGTVTCAGLRITGLSGTGTENQMSVVECNFYNVGYGLEIGGHPGDPNQSIKGTIEVHGGQVSHADKHGAYCGQGTRAIAFRSWHAESCIGAAIYIEDTAQGVTVRDSTLTDNGLDNTTFEVEVGGTTADTSGIVIEDNLFLRCNRGVRVQVNSQMGKTRVARNRFVAKQNFDGRIKAAGGATSTVFPCETLLGASPGWTVDQWVGHGFKINSGTQDEKYIRILSNTVDTVTADPTDLRNPPTGAPAALDLCTIGGKTAIKLEGSAHNNFQVIEIEDNQFGGDPNTDDARFIFGTDIDDIRKMASYPVRDNAYRLYSTGLETLLDSELIPGVPLRVINIAYASDVDIFGIRAGHEGQEVVIFSSNTHPTFKHNSASAAVGNKLFLNGNADVTLTNNECLRLSWTRNAGSAGGWVERKISLTAGALTLSSVEIDFGSVPKKAGSFQITGLAGLTTGKHVVIVQQNGPYTGKGGTSRTDEPEMDMVVVTGRVLNSTTIQCYWNSFREVWGNFKFSYIVSA